MSYVAIRSNRSKRMREAADGLWIVVERVNEGDWSKQSEVWQAAAANARDFYLALIEELVNDARRAAEKG